MFDIGFSEILVIMIVALVVIGPERLPQVARILGNMWGRMQRYLNQVKQDVNNSMELEELREMERKVKAETEALERSVQQAGSNLDLDVRKLKHELDQSARDLSKPASSATLPNHYP